MGIIMFDHHQIELPGGLFVGDKIYRQAQFMPMTGHLEAQIADLTRKNLPDLLRITQTLGCVVGLGPDQKTDPVLARQLCMGDRQYLMLCLAALMGGDTVWFHPECAQCGNLFDIQVNRSKIPVKTGGTGYPFAEINCREKSLCFRIPNGVDELSIQGKPVDQAVHDLLVRCFVPDGDTKDTDGIMAGLAPETVAMIEQALDETAPDVSNLVDTICPECDSRQMVHINIDGPPAVSMMDLYQDIHILAQSYGWNESEILSLPSDRRKLYIRFIDRTRGVYA